MWPGFVVPTAGFVECPDKVAGVPDQHVIQDLAAKGTDDPLADRIRERGAQRCGDRPDSHVPYGSVELVAEPGVVVVDQELRGAIERRSLSFHLNAPLRCW